MPQTRSRRTCRSILQPLAGLLALSFGCAAQAETSPYYIGASASVTRDTNVFRQPTGQSDTIASIGLLGGFDQPISRQRIYASGVVRENRYANLDRLNNTSYGGNLGLDWSTIGKLSGSLSASVNSNLIDYGAGNSVLTTSRNIERSDQVIASVQYGMASLLSLQGSLTSRKVAYSDPLFAANGLKQGVASVGVNYRPSGALTIGTGIRVTRGDYEANAGSFERNDIDITATYVPSGISTLTTRLSYGKQNVEGANSGRDFSGATGYLSWLYQPTGKLQLNTWISRDTGAESGFFNFNGQQVRGVGDTSQLTTTVSIDATYAATGKIRGTAGIRTSRRTLVNGALEAQDTVNAVSVGATYSALRNLQFSCGVSREMRNSSGLLSSPYGATSVTCSGQITLQ